jgi:hypothetical protein
MAVLTVLALPLCAMAQPAVGGLAGLEVDELTKCVSAIESATLPDTAANAYAKGCTINRRSSKLQLAYLRKMLQLGRPDIAQFAAGELSVIDPKSGLAWGTLAYMQTKKAQYLAALTPAVKAAEFEPKNMPICQNAAQLVAWYEAGKRGSVDAEIVRTMKDLPSASKEFAAAYKRAKEAFKKLADVKADKDKQANEADAEAKKAEGEYKKFSDQLKSAGRTYDQTVRQLQDAQQELDRTNTNINTNINNPHRGGYNPQQNNQQQRDNIQRRINDIQGNLRRQEDEGRKIRSEVEKAKREALSKRDNAAKLTREAKRLAEGMPDNFGWLPPAVDGVVTPDATVAKPASNSRKPAEPASSYLVPDQPATKPAGARQAPLEQRLAEAQAAEKLDMAKLCMASDDAAMKARARELLEEIVTKFASTPSAAEAKQLLAKLQQLGKEGSR